jgi:hypothetical protein
MHNALFVTSNNLSFALLIHWHLVVLSQAGAFANSSSDDANSEFTSGLSSKASLNSSSTASKAFNSAADSGPGLFGSEFPVYRYAYISTYLYHISYYMPLAVRCSRLLRCSVPNT